MNSLYTNIVNAEAIAAIISILEAKRPASARPSNATLIELLKFVLEFNNFQFNGENFLQVGGTAMGTRVAPSLANIFMAIFEATHLPGHHRQPFLWKRYLDDVLVI